MFPVTRFFWRRVSWVRLWAIAMWIARQTHGRLQQNLTERERSDLLELMRKSKGRPKNITKKEQERFRNLVRKAAVGDRK